MAFLALALFFFLSFPHLISTTADCIECFHVPSRAAAYSVSASNPLVTPAGIRGVIINLLGQEFQWFPVGTPLQALKSLEYKVEGQLTVP